MQSLRASLLGTVFTLALTTAAFASSCPKHMAAIDAALAQNPQLSVEQMSKVKQLRAKGEAEHKAGQHADSVKTLGEAEAILGLK
jgi:hypothetical protein